MSGYIRELNLHGDFYGLPVSLTEEQTYHIIATLRSMKKLIEDIDPNINVIFSIEEEMVIRVAFITKFRNRTLGAMYQDTIRDWVNREDNGDFIVYQALVKLLHEKIYPRDEEN